MAHGIAIADDLGKEISLPGAKYARTVRSKTGKEFALLKTLFLRILCVFAVTLFNFGLTGLAFL
jgi:hypothetical protein